MEPRHQRGYLERQPALIRGGKLPLFERLCVTPETASSDGVQDIPALLESVLHEVKCLLNTRLPVAAGWSDESSQTVVNYGLPDFSLLSAANPVDCQKLAALLEIKIAAFEPRLRQVRVSFEPDPSNRSVLIGAMRGVLQVASVSEPISFGLSKGNAGFEVERADNASR
jgi:type VI secretion system lysozyme-like protein